MGGAGILFALLGVYTDSAALYLDDSRNVGEKRADQLLFYGVGLHYGVLLSEENPANSLTFCFNSLYDLDKFLVALSCGVIQSPILLVLAGAGKDIPHTAHCNNNDIAGGMSDSSLEYCVFSISTP